MGGTLSVVGTQPLPELTVKSSTALPSASASFGERFLPASGIGGVVEAAKNPQQTLGSMVSSAISPITAPLQHLQDVLSKYQQGDKEGLAFSVGKFLDSFVPGTGGAQQITQNTIKDVQQGNIVGVAGTATGLATQAAVAKGLESLPSAKAAGKAFGELSDTIGQHPVAVTNELAGNLNDLRKASTVTNTNIPPVVNKLINRLDPLNGMGPLTYEEGRAFSSEINQLSAADKMSMTPNTKRLVSNLNHSLKDTIQDTADLAGQGDKLSQAMAEYHHAMQLRNVGEVLKQEMWKAVLTGAGIYGARKIWEAAGPRGTP